MKKSFIYALLSAIALTGTVSFSACSSSDELTDNPNFDPESNKVKTEFVINVTQPNERANSRMDADVVGNGAFQGIHNMQLICFSGIPATGVEIAEDHKFQLASYDTPTIDGTDQTLTNTSSKVYTLYIPTGTTNFLFYATARATVTDKFAQGSLVKNYTSATTVATASPASTDIKFTLEPIVSTETTVTDQQATLIAILNDIKDAQITSGTPATTIKWTDTSSKNETQWRALGSAFKQFTNQTKAGSYDVRQGSSKAVLEMVGDLFNAVNYVYTSESDADAKKMAKAIIDKINQYFTLSSSGSPATYSWGGSYKTGTTGASFETNGYPESQGLPAGSAVLQYTDGSGFAFINNGTMGVASVSTAYDKFTYPSQLTYYCNSGLWQTNVSKNTTDYPTTSADWVTASQWSGWNHNAVNAATRAVAMEENITYGAAQLASTIKLAPTVGTAGNYLTDNAKSVTDNELNDNVFDNSNPINLYVHGMLIGGQPDVAQYDFLPQGTNFNNVIYDRFSTSGTAVNSSGVPNYTLVLDNYTTSNTGQSAVNVAFEMTADQDFYGVSGIIKKDQKFYLIGSLDPSAPSGVTGLTSADWNNHKSFKRRGSALTGYEVNRVFIRDAKTVANFTLGKDCLKYAYSTIPDLRSTQMLFGISVDLYWKTGMSFDVNIGN